MVDCKKRSFFDVFKLELVKGAMLSTPNEFPIIRRTDFKPKVAIPFSDAAKASKAKKFEQWVHFYVDDYVFSVCGAILSDILKCLNVLMVL